MQSNAHLKKVNTLLTPVCWVTKRLRNKLQKLQGKINFTVSFLDIFDIIVEQEFVQCYHTMINPYLQLLIIMEWEGSCMVPLVKVKKTEGHAYLWAMQIVKGLKKGELMFFTTIACSGEDSSNMESLQPIKRESPLKEQGRDPG